MNTYLDACVENPRTMDLGNDMYAIEFWKPEFCKELINIAESIEGGFVDQGLVDLTGGIATRYIQHCSPPLDTMSPQSGYDQESRPRQVRPPYYRRGSGICGGQVLPRSLHGFPEPLRDGRLGLRQITPPRQVLACRLLAVGGA